MSDRPTLKELLANPDSTEKVPVNLIEETGKDGRIAGSMLQPSESKSVLLPELVLDAAQSAINGSTAIAVDFIKGLMVKPAELPGMLRLHSEPPSRNDLPTGEPQRPSLRGPSLDDSYSRPAPLRDNGTVIKVAQSEVRQPGGTKELHADGGVQREFADGKPVEWPRAQKWNDRVGERFFNAGPSKTLWNGDVDGLSKVIAEARQELTPAEMKQFVKKIEDGTNGAFKHTSSPDGNIDEIRFAGARFLRDGSYKSKEKSSESLPDKLPFNPYESVTPERQNQLNDAAKALVNSATANGKEDMTFKKLGDIANELANRKDLNDKEKANIWTTIINSREGSQYQPLGFSYKLDPLTGQMADTIDSNNKYDVGHQLVAFSDDYHAAMAGGDTNAAREKILDHELSVASRLYEGARFLGQGKVGNANFGDIRASAMQVRAMNAYLDEGFSGFARAWNEGFVEGRRSPQAQAVIDEYQKAAEQKKTRTDLMISPGATLLKKLLD